MKDFFTSVFGKVKKLVKYGTWKEVGVFRAMFSSFGKDIYANELVRSCIRALAEHSSKANVKCVRRSGGNRITGDTRLERMIQYRPNLYMNGKAFLYKIRTRLEIDNNAFIFIQRDALGRCIGLYPIPKSNPEAVSSDGELYIKFNFMTGQNVVLPWADLAVLRKDYNSSDIFGDSNSPILSSLELLNTTNEGLSNAIKSTANLRGILKSTKAMLSDDDVKKSKERFVADYMNLENEGGIASLDATQDFTPITMQPQIANYKHIEELRNNIYRYFGVNDDVLMSKVSGESWESFYEAKLEPFLIELGLELTNKIFSEREKGFGNEIIFEANRLQYASTSAKMAMTNLIDRGILTVNEYREILNLAPVDGGDVRLIRKEYAEANKLNQIQGVEDSAAINGPEGIQESGDITANAEQQED